MQPEGQVWLHIGFDTLDSFTMLFPVLQGVRLRRNLQREKSFRSKLHLKKRRFIDMLPREGDNQGLVGWFAREQVKGWLLD